MTRSGRISRPSTRKSRIGSRAPSTGTLSRSTARPAHRKTVERKRRISPPQIIPTPGKPIRYPARPPATLPGWTGTATSPTAERKPPTLPPQITTTTERPTRYRVRPPETSLDSTGTATSRTAERKPPTLPPRRTRTRVTRRSRFLRTCPSPPPRGGTTPHTGRIRSRRPSRRRA